MAWTSMHFAIGMCGGAALSLAPCLILRRGWRIIPVGMTLGGLWALVPDMPRIWREDFPSLPFASTLGDKNFETWLHSIGDVFFFHRTLDSQPKEYALLGLAMIILLYNLSLIGLWLNPRRAKRQHTPAAENSDHPPSYDPPDTPGEPPAPDVIGRITHDRSA